MEYERSHAIAYLHKRMPYTYFSYLRILEEVRTRMPKFSPFSLLDYGAGLGSGAWAGIDVFSSLKKVAAVEPSTEMRRVGKFMTKNLEPEILWVDSLSLIPGGGGERGKFDVVVLGHVL